MGGMKRAAFDLVFWGGFTWVGLAVLHYLGWV